MHATHNLLLCRYTLDQLKACNSTDPTAVERYIEPGGIHTTVLQGIQAGRPLFYRVGHALSTSDECRVWSRIVRHVGLHAGNIGQGAADPTNLLCVARFP